MKPLLGDLPVDSAQRVYLAIKLAAVGLVLLVVLLFLFGVL